jgi:hypothetical protein
MLTQRPDRASIVLVRATWEREMRILNRIALCLVAGLLALTIRALLDGLTFAGGLAGTVLVVLLLTCHGLLRRGHQLEPPKEPAVSQR